MQFNVKTRYFCFVKVLSFIVKLNFNSRFLLKEFQNLASSFQFVNEEHRFNQEYEVLTQNKKVVLVKDGEVVYETLDWIHLLIKLQELFLKDFIRFTRDQYYLLHSAVLVKNGKAILFPGASKSGKSTLSIALLRDGFKYVSDEVAAVDVNTLRTSGFPRAIAIREKTLSLFPNLEPEINHLRYQWVNSGKVREIHYGIPSGRNLAAMNRSFPISAIVFPQYSAKGDTFLSEIKPPSEAVFDLMQCCLNQRRLREKGFKIAARLVRQTKCYSLQTRDLDKACEIISKLV